jgi:hypothetical protein
MLFNVPSPALHSADLPLPSNIYFHHCCRQEWSAATLRTLSLSLLNDIVIECDISENVSILLAFG